MALYIHIPYCEAKCHYCDFNSFAGRQTEFEAMAEALYRDLDRATRRLPMSFSRPLSTVFIGGGTPSVMSGHHVARLLGLARERLGFDDDVEITSEANPGSLRKDWLEPMIEAGLTRLSLGVQSLDDHELRLLGRVHTRDVAIDAVRLARACGVSSISLDLLFGLPGQTLARWSSNLDTALSLDPHHVSLYGLTIAKGTRFGRLHAEGRLDVPDDDVQADMYDMAADRMRTHGYEQYEISNFARRGHRCRHNEVYWRNGEYLGIGPGAVSYLNGWRFTRISRPRDYIDRTRDDGDLTIEGERLSTAASLAETVIVGLRTADGVGLTSLCTRFGLAYEHLESSIRALASDLIDSGLLQLEKELLRLPPDRAFILSNGVMQRFLALPHDLTMRKSFDTFNPAVQETCFSHFSSTSRIASTER